MNCRFFTIVALLLSDVCEQKKMIYLIDIAVRMTNVGFAIVNDNVCDIEI